jgi:hypothetical protein
MKKYNLDGPAHAAWVCVSVSTIAADRKAETGRQMALMEKNANLSLMEACELQATWWPCRQVSSKTFYQGSGIGMSKQRQ